MFFIGGVVMVCALAAIGNGHGAFFLGMLVVVCGALIGR